MALSKVWLPYFQDDTPIILDLSDLAKRLAKKMDYLATVRDGSTGEKWQQDTNEPQPWSITEILTTVSVQPETLPAESVMLREYVH